MAAGLEGKASLNSHRPLELGRQATLTFTLTLYLTCYTAVLWEQPL